MPTSYLIDSIKNAGRSSTVGRVLKGTFDPV
jgi:hypothetical protein